MRGNSIDKEGNRRDTKPGVLKEKGNRNGGLMESEEMALKTERSSFSESVSNMTGHLQRHSSAGVTLWVIACFPTLFQTYCKTLLTQHPQLHWMFRRQSSMGDIVLVSKIMAWAMRGKLSILRYPLSSMLTLLVLYSKEEMSLDI